jgi:site-specific DNA recombinase
MAADPPQKKLRCAIYTRKSTTENLDMDFNTLDAQREAAELFIRSQGWIIRPDRYDDGGFSGGNIERPAMQRLIKDIEDGKVDCVVVYKVDRLSRSLLDFARLIELFDQKGISFVSTTQQFNTAQSLGRLVLNILLSFAQFEREMISERTRDKIGAARRRGKWTGGPPMLGYRVDRERRRLEVVPAEAQQVRVIFQLYLRLRSVRNVMVKLIAMGWKKKAYTTKDGRPTGGGEWDENAVHRLLKNPLYIGKVVYNGEVFDGEHDAIVEVETFERVQQILAAKACGRGPRRGRNPEYLLAGLIHCPRCGKPLTTSSGRGSNGSRKDYRYYTCRTRQARGADKCQGIYVPAADVEPAVIGRVREICADPSIRSEVGRRLDAGKTTIAEDLTRQRTAIEAQIETLTAEGKALVASIKKMGGKGGTLLPARLGEIEVELDKLRLDANELDDRMRGLLEAVGRVSTAVGLLESFDELWDVLAPEERLDLVRLLVERIEVDLEEGRLDLHLHDLAAPFPPVPPPDQSEGTNEAEADEAEVDTEAAE